jgi:hypothetical protein
MAGENRTAQPPGAGDGGTAGRPSRRSLLRGAAGLAGAGLAAGAAGGTVVGAALAPAAAAAPRPAGGGQAAHGEPVVVHVRDARTGDMEIFSGTSQVAVRDPHLAQQLVRAVR